MGETRDDEERHMDSLARRWLILGVLQGVLAAVVIWFSLLQGFGAIESTGAPVFAYAAWIFVPATIVLAGVCGGFWIRYNTPGARRWDYILSMIAFMALWLPATFLATMLLLLIPF